jgi:hypothetical protein
MTTRDLLFNGYYSHNTGQTFNGPNKILFIRAYGEPFFNPNVTDAPIVFNNNLYPVASPNLDNYSNSYGMSVLSNGVCTLSDPGLYLVTATLKFMMGQMVQGPAVIKVLIRQNGQPDKLLGGGLNDPGTGDPIDYANFSFKQTYTWTGMVDVTDNGPGAYGNEIQILPVVSTTTENVKFVRMNWALTVHKYK